MEIILQKQPIAGNVRYQIWIDDLPKNFLGLATDLSFEEPLTSADLVSLNYGSVFSGLSESDKPIVMAKVVPENDKMVLGLTLKSNLKREFGDGYLLQFELSKDATFKSFDNNVVSLFEKGRKDVEDVSWLYTEVGEFNAEVGEVTVNDALIEVERKKGGNEEVMILGSLDGEVENAEISQIELEKIFSDDKNMESGVFNNNIVYAMLFLIILIAALAYRFRFTLKTIIDKIG